MIPRDASSINLRKVENGFVLTIAVVKENDLDDDLDGIAIPLDREFEVHQYMANRRKIPKPVEYICQTLEEAFEKIKEHWME